MAILHVVAFSLGYFLSKIVGFSEKTARTVSIETGMQVGPTGESTQKPLDIPMFGTLVCERLF